MDEKPQKKVMEFVGTAAAAVEENFERGVNDKLQKEEEVANDDRLQKEEVVADDDKL